MNFNNPAAFWLALLLPIIVLLYLLKLRREEKTISSTYLWQRMVRDFQANVPWQRLQRNLLLWLQLLFLAFLILAIARPFRFAQGISSKTVILIVDSSASMQATDVNPSRLEAARQEAYRIVASLAPDARLTLIAAGENPETLVSLSSDQRQINQAIARLQASTGSSNLAPAMQIASAIAQRQPDSHTILLSDGNVILPDRAAIQGRFSYLKIGLSGDNQAVELLTLDTDAVTGELSAFTQIANYSAATVTRKVAIYADQVLVNVAEVELPPDGEGAVLTSGIPAGAQVIEARLLPDGTTQDYLPLDDHAFIIARQGKPVQISLVSAGNLFLETALSLIPALQLELISPGAEPDSQSSLVIYDRIVPGPDGLPPSNLFFIAPPQSTDLFTITGSITAPVPQLVEPVHPLVRGINFSSVSILTAVQLETSAWAQPLVTDLAGPRDDPAPLLWIGEQAGRRIAVLAFDLNKSDLPLQVAFPILVANLINWLAPTQAGQIPPQLAPGAPLRLSDPAPLSNPEAARVQITRPDGGQTSIDLQRGEALFTDTAQLGVYTVELDEVPVYFAVNLFAPQESRLLPQETLAISGVSTQAQSPLDQFTQQEWWRWIALVAFLLLLLEWFVYYRAATLAIVARLRQKIGARKSVL